jgi:hypothetical protein
LPVDHHPVLRRFWSINDTGRGPFRRGSGQTPNQPVAISVLKRLADSSVFTGQDIEPPQAEWLVVP